MNKINTLANIARNYGITESGNLRDDVVSKYTDIIESLDTVDESVISHDISLLPVYKINESIEINKNNIIEEGIIEKVREIIKARNAKKEQIIWKQKVKQRDYDALKKEVIEYKRKEVHSKSDMDKFYRNNDFCIECVSGDNELCQILANILGANYDINTPVEIYVTTGKDFNKIYDLAGDNAYQNDVHHVIIPLNTLKNNNDIVSAKSALKARYFNDIVDNNEYREYKAGRHKKSAQIQWIINAYNESTAGEGYAIDLDSLKSVVESREVSLEEAIQEIRDVNYIGDTIPMYCVLPENINEKMTLESFIDLCNILNESGITPAVINEFRGLSRKDWKAVGKEYKDDDRYRYAQTFRSIGSIIKNMFDNPQKSGNFEKIRPRLLKMVDSCKSVEDVNYLKRDARAGKVQLTKLKQNRPEITSQIDKHIKWIETDYMEALNNKAKELKAKK